MPAPVDAGDAFAEFTRLTGMGRQELEDVLSLPPVGQAVALRAYRDADWRRDPDVFAAVLDVLTAIGSVAGVVGGVAGATSAISALRSL